MSMLDISAIMEKLPHRYPFLLVDRVLECDDETRILAQKNVTINEPFFQGHFPGNPVMPAVLQLESMAQVGGILMLRILGMGNDVTPYFLGIDKARFRKIVRPGDVLLIEIEIIRMRRPQVRMAGRCRVDGQLVSEAELFCMVTPGTPATAKPTVTA